MKPTNSTRRRVLHDNRIDRRSLLLGATAVAGTGAVVAATNAGGLNTVLSRAQEAGPYQPPATPTELGPAVPPEIEEFADDWPAPQGNLAGHRANMASAINAGNVSELGVAWIFPIEASGPFGGMTGQPLIVGDTIYVQDMRSNVFALDRNSGEVRWEKQYDIGTEGPNGVAIGYGMIYGTIGNTAEVFALNADNGEEIWRVSLSNNSGIGVDMAPTVYGNTVYVSTVPGTAQEFYEGGQRGILYALDAQNGTTVWSWDTTTDNLWGNARVNSGGGVWYPLSVDEEGNLYFGVGNPAPWPGTVAFGTPFPNGSSRPGPNDYTNSMVSLDPQSGSVRWYHNADPHDLLDHDFQNTPVLATLSIDDFERTLAIGSGKTGTVVAADADTGEVVWEAAVGQHNQWDDVQEIPEGETISALPGVSGGVQVPIAYANGTVFVPTNNLATEFSPTRFIEGSYNLSEGTGELVALNATDGSVKWQVELTQMPLGSVTVANNVVFTADLTGMVYAFDAENGEELWTYQTSAGVNAPFAVAGDLLIVPAAGPFIGGPEDVEPQFQLIAFQLGATGATPMASPAAG